MIVKSFVLFIIAIYIVAYCFAQNEKVLTVTIGSQVWMKENLNTYTFRNGDSLKTFANYDELYKLGSLEIPATADYENNPEISDEYGKLYNWYAISDNRGLCPDGFRIPTYEDFDIMLTYVFDNKGDDEDLESALGFGGSIGFNLQYGGWCCIDYEEYDDDGIITEIINFANIFNNAALWTISEDEDEDDSVWNLDVGTTWRTDSEGVIFVSSFKSLAIGVRCIKE